MEKLQPKSIGDRVIDKMKEQWPMAFIKRKDVSKFTGGIISPNTLAKADQRGAGPKGSFIVMNNTCYPVEEFCEWLKDQITKRKRGIGKKIQNNT